MQLEHSVYVSITGLRLKSWLHAPRFYWHAFACLRQARRALGNISANVHTIDGVQHTLTVWESAAAMRDFVYSGPHLRAIRIFPQIATGKTFGYETREVPGWAEVHRLWHERAADYAAPD